MEKIYPSDVVTWSLKEAQDEKFEAMESLINSVHLYKEAVREKRFEPKERFKTYKMICNVVRYLAEMDKYVAVLASEPNHPEKEILILTFPIDYTGDDSYYPLHKEYEGDKVRFYINIEEKSDEGVQNEGVHNF